MATRIALYSHDSVGLGHVRRNLAIAHQLSASLPGATGGTVSGLLITGQPGATVFPTPPGWDWLVVPGVAPAEGGYAPRRMGSGMGRVAGLRSAAIGSALEAFAPDLLVIDRHPLGVARELEPALDRLRRDRPGCAVVLGLRDVLDDPSAMAAEWSRIGGADAVRRRFDAVWVYGDDAVHDPLASGEIPAGLAGLVRSTGFLAHGRPVGRDRSPEQPFVLTTVGGGSDGLDLALAAAGAPVPAGHHHVVVTGPQMPAEDRARVRAAAGDDVRVVTSVPDALALVRRAGAVVAMGGYNSVSEVMTTSTPALIVPRVRRRREQAIRAEALARHGLLDVLDPARLDAAAIGDWLAARVGDAVDRSGVDLDGLARVGELAADLICRPARKDLAHAV